MAARKKLVLFKFMQNWSLSNRLAFLTILLTLTLGVISIIPGYYSEFFSKESRDRENQGESFGYQLQQFAIVNFKDDTLTALIEQITGYTHAFGSPQNRIEFTYSNQILETNESSGLFYYPGGHIRILIDDNACQTGLQLRIYRTLRIGNPYDSVKSIIEQQVSSYIKDHREQVAATIRQCFQ